MADSMESNKSIYKVDRDSATNKSAKSKGFNTNYFARKSDIIDSTCMKLSMRKANIIWWVIILVTVILSPVMLKDLSPKFRWIERIYPKGERGISGELFHKLDVVAEDRLTGEFVKKIQNSNDAWAECMDNEEKIAYMTDSERKEFMDKLTVIIDKRNREKEQFESEKEDGERNKVHKYTVPGYDKNKDKDKKFFMKKSEVIIENGYCWLIACMELLASGGPMLPVFVEDLHRQLYNSEIDNSLWTMITQLLESYHAGNKVDCSDLILCFKSLAPEHKVKVEDIKESLYMGDFAGALNIIFSSTRPTNKDIAYNSEIPGTLSWFYNSYYYSKPTKCSSCKAHLISRTIPTVFSSHKLYKRLETVQQCTSANCSTRNLVPTYPIHNPGIQVLITTKDKIHDCINPDLYPGCELPFAVLTLSHVHIEVYHLKGKTLDEIEQEINNKYGSHLSSNSYVYFVYKYKGYKKNKTTPKGCDGADTPE